MNIGIICYPSVGGSGIVATELGKQLARRGHRVHFISSDLPFRLNGFEENVFFHQVETPSYPLFKHPPFELALANKIVEVTRLEHLEILHAHYAVPHATAAFLAREMLAPLPVKVVTTLHGTDITLMGVERSFADTVTFSINRSDAVTAVSDDLVKATYRNLPGVTADIISIPNFLECEDYHRLDLPRLHHRFAPEGEKLIMHMSNFRPVKRVENVLKTFAKIAEQLPARLLLVGDGPDVPMCCQLATELGIRDRVHFLGNQEQVVELLSVADLFLLPSAQESFGLAALEAMACEVPVITSSVGGLPEVVEHGVSGFLFQPDDVNGMAAEAISLLSNPERHSQVARAARARVIAQYCARKVVPLYEDLYTRVLNC